MEEKPAIIETIIDSAYHWKIRDVEGVNYGILMEELEKALLLAFHQGQIKGKIEQLKEDIKAIHEVLFKWSLSSRNTYNEARELTKTYEALQDKLKELEK